MTNGLMFDLSQLPAPQAIETLNFEGVYADVVADFLQLWEARRTVNPELPPINVLSFETDPVAALFQEFSYREMLIRARVNAAVKAVLPAFSRGTDLDAIVARTGVGRAVGETDLQLIERYLVSLARPSAGSLLGYRSRILETWPGRGDVAVYGPTVHGRRGDVDIVLAAPLGQSVPGSVITTVQSKVSATDAKPLTDVVTTRPAAVVPYQVRLRLTVAEAQNAGITAAAVKAAATAFVLSRYLIGVPIKRSAIVSTGYVPGVIAVENIGAGGDVAVAVDEVAWCSPASIEIQVAN